MTLGLIARADNRGLGMQTWDFYRHMKPDRTLVIDMGDLTPYKQHFDRFPDAMVLRLEDGLLPTDDLLKFVDGCTHIFTAETPYDYRLFGMARNLGAKTIVQSNFEFCRWVTEPDLARPDVLVFPSLWHTDRWPEREGMRLDYLAAPVDRELFPFEQRTRARNFLHIAGHKTYADRNGTRLVLKALRYIKSKVTVTIRTQDPLGSMPHPRNVNLYVDHFDHTDRRDLYRGGDVLLFPRRFGGQSLQLNEAMSLGMPVIATDCDPQSLMHPPLYGVPVQRIQPLSVQSGTIDAHTINPRDLALAIDALASNDEIVARQSQVSNAHAEAISWQTLRPRYDALCGRLP